MNQLDNLRLLECLGGISDRYILEAAPRLERRGKTVRPRAWRRRAAAAAACLCLAAGGLWGLLRNGRGSVSASGTGLPQSEPITWTEEGVHIPQTRFSLSDDTAACMLGFFIYNGRSYVFYDWASDPAALEVGPYLGTARGSIDEWTPAEGYVELAGSVRGDFYALQGYDPDFLLCIPREDGTQLYINDNDLTLKTGAELFEDRLHLSQNRTGLEYEAQDSWYYDRGERHALDAGQEETVRAFLAALDTAEFQPVYTPEGRPAAMPGNTLWHVWIPCAGGLSVHLRLAEGGYVSFDGLLGVCLQITDGSFEALTELLEAGAAEPW